MNTCRVCVVIPAFNEGRHVADVVTRVALAGHVVLVVDDGSHDDTPTEAGRAGAVVVSHLVNRGKGAAIRTAFQWVVEHGFDAALFLDADGQHLPEEVPRFVQEYEKTRPDLIVGSRMHDWTGMPAVRKLSNTVSSKLVSLLAGTRVTDSQSGYRLLSADLIGTLTAHGGQGFDFESEMIIDAVRGGFAYAEVPISCVYADEKSYYHPIRDGLGFVSLVSRKGLSLVMGRIRGRRA